MLKLGREGIDQAHLLELALVLASILALVEPALTLLVQPLVTFCFGSIHVITPLWYEKMGRYCGQCIERV